MHRKRLFHFATILIAFVLICLLGSYAMGETAAPASQTGAEAASPQQETIVEDFEKGYWFYENPSQELRIEIHRYELTDQKLVWYEADIQTSEKTPLGFFHANEENPGKGFKFAERIARENHLVFAINDDQFGHRMYNRQSVGIILRDGKVLSQKTKKNGNLTLPNLDVGAFFPDGSLQVFLSAEHTPEAYLEMGVQNTLSFGPYILRNGEINPNFKKYYRVREPRCALGMIEPYHYVVIVAEGRISRTKGIGLQWIGERMQELDVREAINLDGGQTSCIVFMGKKLELNNPQGKVRNSRSLSGMIGLGTSDQVPPYVGVEK